MKPLVKNHLQLERTQILAVLNVTPDSFSDGGKFTNKAAAVDQAAVMLEEGADWIDIGGESTRPGAAAVSVEHELDRVLPVIEAIASRFATPISVDTSKPEVMRAAVAAGASLINDVRALREPGALQVAAELGVPVCLMHMQGQPRSMQAAPEYDDVVADVSRFLLQRAAAAEAGGIAKTNIMLDPGFGFGKTLEHNLALLSAIPELQRLGYPLLVGVSRKSMFQQLLGRSVSERLSAGLAVASLMAEQRIAMLRVHDVRETADAVRVVEAIRTAR